MLKIYCVMIILVISLLINSVVEAGPDDYEIKLSDSAGVSAFELQNNSGTPIVRMGSDGKTGFGTTTPSTTLHVIGTITTSAGIEFPDGTTQVTASGGGGSKFVDGTIASDAVYTTGNVGIGTTTPDTLLVVIGTITVTGNIKTDDNVTNTFLGNNSGSSNTTGQRNTFVGGSSGQANTTGVNNTFVGSSAGSGNSTGTNNTFVGFGAGQLNTTNSNTFVGGRSGYSNTTGQVNTFVGMFSGKANTIGVDNTFVGGSSGQANTTGGGNTFVGKSSGKANTTSGGNTFVGEGSGDGSTGSNNTFVGRSSGTSVSNTGSNNTFLGFLSGAANSTGGSNTFVGGGSGQDNTTGINNTYLGSSAGANNSTGSDNVFLGHLAGFSESGSNKLYIDNSSTTTPLIFGDFSADTLTANGNFGISTSTFGANAVSVLGLANGTAPTSSPADMIQLYAEDVSASSELKVRDELGNVTVLSPHNFSLIGKPTEPMAWSYYSERGEKKINVDMLKTVRLVERMSGEKLVHLIDRENNTPNPGVGNGLHAQIEELRAENRALKAEYKALEDEILKIKDVIGL